MSDSEVTYETSTDEWVPIPGVPGRETRMVEHATLVNGVREYWQITIETREVEHE